ncbi:hypothetical protein D0Y65_002553 [Glycine soja]|uniref:Uncharacterized protein n=1 Tax=Glycine soja TaxID=3848 RepID=A0A445LHM1_GLYSO|nr:hypothetical protein D0Y65_002553 [Glycine soja]
MGNEMGNNNTSAIKEEDNISEAEKKTFQEDTSEVADGMSQDIHEDNAKEEIQNVPTSKANDVMEKASEASNDITNELGKGTWQEEGHAEDQKEKTQTISTVEAKDEDTQEKAIGIASNHTASMLENDSMEGDTHASDVNMENQMPPTAEAEGVQEKAEGLVSEDATTELGKVSLQEYSHEDYEKEKMQMNPTEEAKDVQEEATGLNSSSTASMPENDLLGEDSCKSDMNMENKMHPTAEVEDVQEKATGMASDYATSSLENDLLKGDAPEDDVHADHQKHQIIEGKVDHQQIAARSDFNDKTSEFDDKPQEDKQDGNVVNPAANGIYVQEKTIIISSDAPLNFTNSFEGSGNEITGVRQPEKSPNDESIEAQGGNSEILSSSSLEGTQEYEKQEETRLREHLSVTYNNHLNNEPSIQQGDETTEVSIPEKSSNDGSVEAEGGNFGSLSSCSLEGTEEYDKQEETCLREQLLVTYNNHVNDEPSIQQGDETTEATQPEKSTNDGSVEAEGGHSESLSSSSLEGTKEYEKQEEPCFRDHLLVTYNIHLNNEPSIQQGDEITEVIQPEKSPNDGSVEAEGGHSESLSSSSLEGTEEYEKQEESCFRDHLLVTYNNHLNNEPSIQQGDEINEVIQPEKSPNDGSVEAEGGHSASLPSSSLEGTEEYEKQEESCFRDHLLQTYDNHLNNEPSIQQGNETTEVRQPEKSPNDGLVEVEGGNSESLSSSSLEGTEEYEKQEETCFREHLLVTYKHHFNNEASIQQEKEMESHKKLCADKSDGKDRNEFGSSVIDTCGTPPSIDNTNGNSLTKVNCTTEDSLTSLLDSSIVDNPLKFDHEENYEVLYGESILSKSGSTMENSHDYKPDQCMKDSLKEYKSGMVYTCDMAIGSNGDTNGERKMLPDSNACKLATSDQVEEPKVTENGVPFDVDAYVNNYNKASEESGTVSDQKHFVVPEVKRVSLIAGLTVVDCRHEEGESYKNKIEESEASRVMVNTFDGTQMSEQCNSDLVTINQEESFPLQYNSSLLHICDDNQDNVKQDQSFTATSMPNSDWKLANETKNFAIDNHVSSKLTVPSVDLVDDEAFEKREEHLQHVKAASSAGAELTTSTATMSIEPSSIYSIFANGGYETRDSVTRLSTESNPDNSISCQMQKSPSFNLNLRKEARAEESDKIPLLHQDMSADKSLSKKTSQNLIKSVPHDDYEQCMLHIEEMPVQEKIVTMERSYSRKSKAPFIGLLKEEEEAHLLNMPQIQHNHVGTKNAVSSTSHKRKEKRKPRSSFFSSCICCATVP